MAKQIGVTASSIFNWESNKISPQIHHIPRIIALLGYDPWPAPGTISERLINARRLLGLSQRAMAKRLKIDPTTLARWEQERSKPSRGLWKRVELFLFAMEIKTW